VILEHPVRPPRRAAQTTVDDTADDDIDDVVDAEVVEPDEDEPGAAVGDDEEDE
jgi:hypothetical protein